MENHQSFLNRLKLKVTDKELTLIDWAYVFAKYGHRNQKRDDGTRYFNHLRSVALILIDELEIFDFKMIIASLLHDILEDSFLFNKKKIKFIFGKKVAKMISTLSMPKMDPDIFTDKTEKLAVYHQKIKTSSLKIIIIKLCDRLHNLRTMPNCTEEKIKRKHQETIDHYVPLINLLEADYPEIAKIFHREYEIAFTQLPKTT